MVSGRIVAVCGVTTLILVIAVFGVPAQDGQVKTPELPGGEQAIALLDVGYVFQNCPRFKERMSQLKSEIDQAEARVKEQKAEVERMTKQLEVMSVGSPEYATLEQKIAGSQAELAAAVNVQKATFLRREASIYCDVYEEIKRETEDYAKTHHIAAVMRFSGDPIDRNKPDSVLAFINRPVVWHDPKCDITRIILGKLGGKSNNRPAEQPASKESAPPTAPSSPGGATPPDPL